MLCTKQILIPVILLAIFSIVLQSAFAEVENLTPLERYDASELILVGKVISLRENTVQGETEYDIKVEQYLKNPKPYNLITVVGAGTKSAPPEDGPIFSQNDRVLLYLNKYDEKYSLSPFSFKASLSCDPTLLLDLKTIPSVRPSSSPAGSDLYFTDMYGNESDYFSPNEKVVINYDALNSHPHDETLAIRVSVNEINKTESIFTKEQQIAFDACDGRLVTWNINPTKVGDYEAKVVFDGRTLINSFVIRQNIGFGKTIYPITSEEPNWKTYHAIGKYLNSDPPKPDQVFNIKYRVINGVIESFKESGQGSFLAQVNSENNGTLEILFPRNYPYTNGFGEGHGESFSVFNHNGPPKTYEVNLEKTDCFFEYSIPFAGNQNLELAFGSITIGTPFHGDKVPTNCNNETIYFPPPTKQFKSGTDAREVICKEGLMLVAKARDDSPACVKPLTYNKLVERGWVTLQGIQTTFYLFSNDTRYEIPYHVTGWKNKILNMTLDLEAKSLLVTMQTKNNGELTITLPRYLLDSEIEKTDAIFFVLVDGEEVELKNETRTDTTRTITIGFQQGTRQIEIIGATLI